jgi:hypothetical protein
VGDAPSRITNTNFVLYLNDKPVQTLGMEDNLITFQIPNGTAVGAAVLRVEVAGEKSLPILMLVEPPPPRILSAVSTGSEKEDKTVRTGQLLALTVDNLAARDAVPDPGGIAVKLGGVELRVAQVLRQDNLHRVLVLVSDEAPSGFDVPLTVSVGTRTSEPLNVVVEDTN